MHAIFALRERLLSAMPSTLARRAEPDAEATPAARARSSFHAEQEYGDVIWRFTPVAAKIACDVLFQPSQEMTIAEDGSLTVKFFASGCLEMAWHLYQWGMPQRILRQRRCAEWWRNTDEWIF